MSVNVAEPEGPQMTQYGAYTLHAGQARLHTRTRMHAPGHPTPPHTRTCAHTRTCTHHCARMHTKKYVILIAFPRQQWLCKRASILRYMYIACIVKSQSWIMLLSLLYIEPSGQFCTDSLLKLLLFFILIFL